MPSVHQIQCPVCGVENAPCTVKNGEQMYHLERKRAAYRTTYEHPDCSECRKLKDAMVRAEDSYRTYKPDFGGTRPKPKSRWPKGWRDGSRSLELGMNFARAEYEFHLGSVHKDQSYQRDLGKNFNIIVREGRLGP
jgi:hypothetical protein